MALLETRRVSKHFGGLVALRAVDLRVDEGKIVGIIGPNGAGKTTLFNIISGFYSPSNGRVIYDGRDVTGLKSHRLSEMGILRTWQRTRPFLTHSVIENVMIGAMFGRLGRDSRDAERLALEKIGEVGLANKAHTKASDLNLGETKRMEIARVLAARPRLLLLDEPVAGLNPTEANWFMELFRKINSDGVTIVLIEHVLKAVMKLCEEIVVLDHGEKIAEGRPDAITKSKAVIDAFLGEQVSG